MEGNKERNPPNKPELFTKRGSITMEEGQHFSTRTLAHALLSVEEIDASMIFSHFEDNLFDILCEGKEKIPLRKLLGHLTWMGLRKDDPRLQESFKHIKKIEKDHRGDDEIFLDRTTFRECITANIVLIKKAFEAEFIIPEFQKFSLSIDEIYNKCLAYTEGKVSSYLPQLARCNPDHWGVSVCTVDGQRYSVGDVGVPFSLQSLMKPLVYALMLNEHGPDVVHRYVGQEPSGEQFDHIKLDANDRPHNPMINAGGIVTVSLISLVQNMQCLADKFDYVQRKCKKLAGGEYLGFNNAMYLSERESADRNFALGYYMQEYKCFPENNNLKETLDLYFQLCSMEVTTESMAVMAATLATGGLCPLTGEKCLSGISVQNTLSLMYSCGMYDYSGQFAFSVGLPAKSSISGCILLVVPDVMGIALWSPALDQYKNSHRGIRFCFELMKKFNFHQYDGPLNNESKKIDPRRKSLDNCVKNAYYILFSASKGDIKALTRMFLSGVDMQVSDYDGRTALHLASAQGHLDCVQFLVNKCQVPHGIKDRWDHTPLEEATRFEHQEIVDFLKKLPDPPEPVMHTSSV